MTAPKLYSLDIMENIRELSISRFDAMTGSIITFGEGDAVDGRLVRWWVWQYFADSGLPLPVGAWIRRRIPSRFTERRGGQSCIVARLHPSVAFIGFKDDGRGPDGWADARRLLVVDPDDVASAIGQAVLQRRLTVNGRRITESES